MANAARWAGHVATQAPLHAILQSMGCHQRQECEEASRAREAPHAAGVSVTEAGATTLTELAAAEYQATPWAQDTPPQNIATAPSLQKPSQPGQQNQRILGRAFSLVGAMQAAQLWTSAEPQRKTALLSAGGKGSGAM